MPTPGAYAGTIAELRSSLAQVLLDKRPAVVSAEVALLSFGLGLQNDSCQ